MTHFEIVFAAKKMFRLDDEHHEISSGLHDPRTDFVCEAVTNV